MKLFKLQIEEDFGAEIFLDLLVFKRFSVLSFAIYHEIYGSMPCLEFVLGLGQLASLLISFPNWTFKVQLLARSY